MSTDKEQAPEDIKSSVIPDSQIPSDCGNDVEETPVVKMKSKELKQKQIVPVFIGCQDSKVIKLLVDSLLSEGIVLPTENDYDVVVMGEEVLNSAVGTYFFNRLEKDNQDAIQRQQNDIKLRNQALKKAIEFDDMMRKYLNIKDSNKNYTFSAVQLRYAIEMSMGKKISNKSLREVIDFISLYNYITPTLLNVKYIKQMFEFTLDDVAMLLNTEWLGYQANQQLESLKMQIQMLDDNRQLLKDKIFNKQSDTSESLDNTKLTTEDGENNNGHLQPGVDQLSNTESSEQAVATE